MKEAVVTRLGREGAMEIVGMASSADELVDLYRETHPDVVICDVTLNRSSGIDATARIVKEFPGAHIVMFSADISQQTIEAALKAGATGYIDKRVDGAELYTCIRLAAEGGPVFDHTTSSAVIAALRSLPSGPEQATRPGLSPREIEVVGLMAEGLTYDQIGDQLFLSGKTVKTVAARLLKKMDVPDRTAAVATALRMGIIR